MTIFELFLKCRLAVSPNGRKSTVLVWVDTAFNGGLVLPHPDIKRLGLQAYSLTRAEFDRLLGACDTVCKKQPESWKFLLRGLWETGLRLCEAMMVSWDVPNTIRPKRHVSGEIVLELPGKRQKNKKDQTRVAGVEPKKEPRQEDVSPCQGLSAGERS